MEPALLILAAGMGRRYGGLKQMDAIGPSGETIMDYSIYDAQRAGIKKIVFVIKKESENEFNELVIKKYKAKVDVDYVVQEQVNAQRIKPWGTGHAVLAGAEKIKEPFIVINADDFYGFRSFEILAEYLRILRSDKQTEYGLVGFSLKNTLSDNGTVSRAVCEEDSQHYLKTITERVSIRRPNEQIVFKENNKETVIDGNTIVSINLWGFAPTIFPKLKEMFEVFLSKNHDNPDKEFFLPSCIDELIKTNFARVKILKTDAEWFGLTYKEDKQAAVNKINKLIAMGEYPGNLFQGIELENIISNFKIKGKYISSEPISTGHINDTYLIHTDGNEKYVLQKINDRIFKNILQLTNNILLVTKHIAGKIDSNPDSDLLREKLALIQTVNQNYFFKDSSCHYWRLYNYIDGKSYNIIDSIKAEKAGKAFGKFQQLLADLPAKQLFDTIPDFHNMKTRYKAFLASVEKNICERAGEVKQEIVFVQSYINEMIAMQELIDDGTIPMRITHNDTKINNILFDKNDTPVCIVDLDTVMPGSVLYDFGDAIRTAANTSTEDESDLSKITIDIKIFAAYTKGYLETAKSFLIKSEIDKLALSAKYITFIMGLRFLTDYLDGDKYYKIDFARHNLQRARAQFKLVESMDEQFEQMKAIVNKYAVRRKLR